MAVNPATVALAKVRAQIGRALEVFLKGRRLGRSGQSKVMRECSS
jgi:hypothetical protein